MDIVIEESILDKFLEYSEIDSPHGHRGIHNLLLQIRELGYLWESQHRIVLYDGESSGDLDEDYASYLNKRAAGIKTTFESKV
jgi:hypothetical protein